VVISILLATSASAAPKIGVAYRGWRVQDVELLGVDRRDARTLKAGLALTKREGMLLGRLRRPRYQPELLAEDVQRVRLFFATRGYPGVRVEPNLIADARRQRLHVELRVTLGPRVYLESIRVPGMPDRLSTDPKALGIAPGDPFIDARLVAAERALLNLLFAHGYAAASVQRELEPLDARRVRLHFKVTPGELHYVQDVTFEGSRQDLRKLAQRTVGVEPGALSTPKAVRDGSKRLQQLQLFRRIEVETPRVEPDGVVVKYRLIDREPRTLEAGIGAWTDGIIQGRAGWAHRNLFRGGRGFGVRGLASEVEQEVSVSVWQPSVLGPKTRAAGIVRGRFENEETYESAKLEVEAILTYSFSVDRDHSVETGIVYARADYSGTSAAVEQPNGSFLTAHLHWINNASDDRFDPRRGFLVRSELEGTIPGAGSRSDFFRAQITGVYYVPLPYRSSLALRATPGYALDYGERGGIPPDRLFYAGGALSMRGFKRRDLGPRDNGGTPVGGSALLELSSEVRLPGWWRLGVAGFIDAAQVWSEPGDVRLRRMEVAAGPGLAIQTPIGPLRSDFAFRLTDFDSTQPDWVFHLYIGNPF
jgi:outer membrane protein assembly complex protein YaeT